MFAYGWSVGMRADLVGMRLLFGGDENVLELVVIVVQLSDYTKSIDLYTYTGELDNMGIIYL